LASELVVEKAFLFVLDIIISFVLQRSTVILDGPDVVVQGLDVDGALVVKAVPGARVGA
jgi:hypothetical protein